MTPRLFAALGLLVLALGACTSGKSRYRATLAAADAKARNGDADEAALLYRRAANETSERDRAIEAGYREAWMWRKRGNTEKALARLEELAAQGPPSSRSGRIWLDIGRWREASGDSEGARAAYRKVMDYPASGLGPRAADAIARSAPGPRSDVYRQFLPAARGAPEFASFLRLRIAQAEADEGHLDLAIATCESVAKADPLPKGVYTDDALLLAAKLRRALGDHQGALVTVDALLSAQEKSAFVGSYERPSFAEARWLAADILQHDLADPAGAERMLDDLVRLDPTSRLRDDALFRAAWLARHARRDEHGACLRAQTLAALKPPSTLVECLGEVCPKMERAAPRTRRCARAVELAQGSKGDSDSEIPSP